MQDGEDGYLAEPQPVPPLESSPPHLGHTWAWLFNLKCYCGPQNYNNYNSKTF